LCPCFLLAETEVAAAEFKLLEIVQATFYAMLVNKTFELGVAHEYTAERMKSSLVGLRWSTFEVWMLKIARGRVQDRPVLLPPLAMKSRFTSCSAPFVLSRLLFNRLY